MTNWAIDWKCTRIVPCDTMVQNACMSVCGFVFVSVLCALLFDASASAVAISAIRSCAIHCPVSTCILSLFCGGFHTIYKIHLQFYLYYCHAFMCARAHETIRVILMPNINVFIHSCKIHSEIQCSVHASLSLCPHVWVCARIFPVIITL